MKGERKFDAVKMMREIRDKLSKEFMNMSYDEQKRYIKERVEFKARQVNESSSALISK
ncbi:MAG: hypothetical protein QMD71_06615 [bacterium]|nr:hypothetical protein [bacterium]